MESSKGSAQPVSLEELFKSKNVSVGTMTASLFRNRNSGKVVYLEAGKDFADILLSLLLLPVGTIIHLLSEGIHVKPALGGLISILPSPIQRVGLSRDYYKCDICHSLFPTSKGSPCWAGCPEGGPGYKCNKGPYSAFKQDIYRHPSIAGLVTRDSKYMIADNLEITHLTTNNSVSVLNKMNVSSLHDLECIDITITITQLLQSALNSKTCLDDVFGQSSHLSRLACSLPSCDYVHMLWHLVSDILAEMVLEFQTYWKRLRAYLKHRNGF